MMDRARKSRYFCNRSSTETFDGLDLELLEAAVAEILAEEGEPEITLLDIQSEFGQASLLAVADDGTVLSAVVTQGETSIISPEGASFSQTGSLEIEAASLDGASLSLAIDKETSTEISAESLSERITTSIVAESVTPEGAEALDDDGLKDRFGLSAAGIAETLSAQILVSKLLATTGAPAPLLGQG